MTLESVFTEETVLCLFCETCNEEMPFILDREDDRNEVYRCPKCETTKSFAVR